MSAQARVKGLGVQNHEEKRQHIRYGNSTAQRLRYKNPSVELHLWPMAPILSHTHRTPSPV